MRVLLASVLMTAGAASCLVAVLPPFVIWRGALGGVVALLCLVAALRARGLRYELRLTGLVSHGLLVNQWVAVSDIRSIQVAARIERQSGSAVVNWGFHADRLVKPDESERILRTLRQWLIQTPTVR